MKLLERKKKPNQNRIIQEAQPPLEESEDNQAIEANETNENDTNENGTNDNDEETPADETTENEKANDDDDQETNDDGNAKDTSDPVMEIEGIVHGEADNNVVQSASRVTAVDDEDNKV